MYQIARFYPRKVWKRRRRLRPLVNKTVVEPKEKPSCQYYMFLLSLIVGISVTIYYNEAYKTVLWRDFLSSYRNQYKIIVHGKKDYCQPVINTTRLISDISRELLNQASALRRIEAILKNESQFATIAIAGTSGVGKSLFVELLEDTFPWQENAQSYSWSEFNTPAQKEEDIMTFLNHLSECGRNLIVIDNLQTDDIELIQEYTEFVRHFLKENSRFNLILVYVFNVPKYSHEHWQQYEERMEALRGLSNIELIHFRNLNANDLDDCIRHEAKHLDWSLEPKEIEEIKKTIDVERSGCKNVRSKVLTYGGMDSMFAYL